LDTFSFSLRARKYPLLSLWNNCPLFKGIQKSKRIVKMEEELRLALRGLPVVDEAYDLVSRDETPPKKMSLACLPLVMGLSGPQGDPVCTPVVSLKAGDFQSSHLC
jgi:hypothetical protein